MTAAPRQLDEATIAEVVRQVVLRLMAETGSAPPSDSPRKSCGCGCQGKNAVDGVCLTPAGTLYQAPAAPPADPAEWHFSGPVLSLASLRERPAGTNRIVVGPRTLVTPAVKDELKDRGLVWSRAVRSTPDSTRHGAAAVEPTECFSQAHPGRHDAALVGLPLVFRDAERLDGPALAAAVAASVAQRGRAIVIAREPYTAVCDLNRTATLRAGYAPTATALGKLVHQLRPNVVVVDARKYSHATLRQILDEFATRPPVGCGARGGDR